MKRLYLLLSYAFCVTSLFAQLENAPFAWRRPVVPADSNRLSLGIDVLGFGKNNEYFHTVIEGYTLFGYQMHPYLSYRPGAHIRIDGGIFLQKDFGNTHYSTIAPTFTLKYKLDHLSVMFGTLEGSGEHRLIEPLYDFERMLNKRLENGLQVRWLTDQFFADAWVDWQHMIYPGDTTQERIWGGLSIEKFFHTGDWTIGIPLQGTAIHHGGQINTGTTPLATLLHGAAGIDAIHEGDHGSWGLKVYGTWYSDRSSVSQLVFTNGNGVFINPFFTLNHFTLMGSYWNGYQYVTIMGSDLYSSANDTYPNRIDKEREFYMMRALYDLPLRSDFIFTLRAEALYDTYSESIQYSYGIYINFGSEFCLKHAKDR